MITINGSSVAAVTLFVSLTVFTPELDAWDGFGHHVVGAIAWEHLEPATRQAVVDLLLEAPPDADLASLMPPGPRSLAVRSRELFIKACVWPDIVRDEAWPEREEAYNRSTWHFVNHFWRSGPNGAEPLPDLGTNGELVMKLEDLTKTVVDPGRSAAARAVDLAWILHLVGDVHQPLHDSARVTESEPEGDRGGNDFHLDDLEAFNLHAFWDGILTHSQRQRHTESYERWVDRVAGELTAAHPRSGFLSELAVEDFAAWSREGFRIAMNAYPDSLVRDRLPPRTYRESAFAEGSRQAALAGYRLAAVLNRLFATSP